MSRMVPDHEDRQDSPVLVPDQASQVPGAGQWGQLAHHEEQAEDAEQPVRAPQAESAEQPAVQAEPAARAESVPGPEPPAAEHMAEPEPVPDVGRLAQAQFLVQTERLAQTEASEQRIQQAGPVNPYEGDRYARGRGDRYAEGRGDPYAEGRYPATRQYAAASDATRPRYTAASDATRPQYTVPGDDARALRRLRPLGHRAPSTGRFRRFTRRPAVRVVGALIGVFLIWVCFSVGQALTAPNGYSTSEKLAEWARDHYLGPAVTFGEWLTYQPPKVGGKPSFSLTVPKGEAAAAAKAKADEFKPIIPAPLTSLAGSLQPGEGQWRVLERVKGEPAVFGTFLRSSATYSSYVSGIVSMDQRLVTFQLHPGYEDPGGGGWGSNSTPWIPPSARTGLLATFNGGFKLSSAQGGFYLNGHTHGALQTGAASVVYYRDGTMKIGVWGRDVGMTSQVIGVRQNLKLIVDQGQVPSSVDSNVQTNWGATLGGGYYVWRSGVGITKDGRIIYAYGPALNVRGIATLLQHAGAVEAMELDINPDWTAYDYYHVDGKPSDPSPVALLPTQPSSTERYYSVWSRDFTAVYAR